MMSPNTGLAPRERAHTILHEVLDRGRPLDDVLHSDKRFDRLNPRDRAFARNLVATTLRRLGQIDALLADRLERPLPRSAAAARNALRLGVCQILFLDTQTHAAVDTAVTLAARRGPERFRGLVNAILRRVADEGAAGIDEKYPPSLNMPAWLRDSWADAYGDDEAAAIVAAGLRVPTVDLSVKERPEAWAETLGGTVISGYSVRLERAGDVTGLQGFPEGAWWVQDASAALPARILMSALADKPSGSNPVCDLCAAPGGKTAQFAAAGHPVTAVDASADRLVMLRSNLARLGLAADVVQADATGWLPDAPFAGVLLDAPCTATGTIRRHPDIPHLKRQSDVARQAGLQSSLLSQAARMVRPGGILVYSVCSLQPPEGVEQIDAFLATHDIFGRDPVTAAEAPAFEACITDAGDVVTLPSHLGSTGGSDGFFIARLRRRPEEPEE